MGCTSSTSAGNEHPDGRWRLKLSRKACRQIYQEEGTVPANAESTLVTLRVFLEDPTSLREFAKYVSSVNRMDLLRCWIDVLAYKAHCNEENNCVLRCAQELFRKYLDGDVTVLGAALDELESEAIMLHLSEAEKNRKYALPSDLFDGVGQLCLVKIHDELFSPYRLRLDYARTLVSVLSTTNRVCIEDFEYGKLLGKGGYGFVVHCRKKSTGVCYAMKIQTKISLLDCYFDCPNRVTHEKEAMVLCNHPFIVRMDYAFQTPALVMMVTSLGGGCHLGDFAGQIGEDYVHFYTAEIVLALGHIHKMGLIYRDLKPENVLVGNDLHIRLVDFGGIVDVAGRNLGRNREVCTESAALFNVSTESRCYMERSGRQGDREASESRKLDSNEASLSMSSFRRATSIMGTAGFMSPEMLVQLVQNPTEQKGYSKTADFWSLGVLVFILLTGRKPFTQHQVSQFALCFDNEEADDSVYAITIAEVNRMLVEVGASDSCRQFILALMRSETERLGNGKQGLIHVKAHKWFDGMNWELLAEVQLTPPNIGGPELLKPTEFEPFASFGDMLVNLRMHGVGDCTPAIEDQEYFMTWDMVSPEALRGEIIADSGLRHSEKAQQSTFLRRFIGSSRVSETVVTPTEGSIAAVDEDSSNRLRIGNSSLGISRSAKSVSGILRQLSDL